MRAGVQPLRQTTVLLSLRPLPCGAKATTAQRQCPDSEVRKYSRHIPCELRNQRDTSNSMIPVPLLNPKFAIGVPARLSRTSGSGHECPDCEVRETLAAHSHANFAIKGTLATL